MVQCNNHGPRVAVNQAIGGGPLGGREARERSIQSKELGGGMGGMGVGVGAHKGKHVSLILVLCAAKRHVPHSCSIPSPHQEGEESKTGQKHVQDQN